MQSARPLQSVTAGVAGVPGVLACALDRHQQARLVDALRSRGMLRFVDSFDGLRDTLHHTTGPIDAVVVPARAPHGESARNVVRELAAERPRAAIVVYCHPGWQHDTDIRALAMLGAHQFVFAGINDDVLALRAVIESARRQCAAECVMQLLEAIVPAPLHPMVEAVLARPDEITDLASLAAALRVHRKTLFNVCRRAAFIAPAELLAWVRLVLVGYLLETTGCTIERIAADLSYPSPTALRNTFRRHVGVPASSVRAAGGSRSVVGAFARRLADRPEKSGPLHVV
jgi:AraC-like DNA-binding protein